MSQENAEFVRKIFEAGGANSAGAVLPFVPADVVWHPPPEWIVDSPYRGHDGVREAMSVFTETFDDYRAELHEARDAGDRVVALVWQSGVIKGSREPVRQAIGVVYPISVTASRRGIVLPELGGGPRSRRSFGVEKGQARTVRAREGEISPANCSS